ncbi:c-type cytochrome [Alcaligenaceae bacterium]|nr:c-type cytochrome [Alcaligenaceae bacterium]
MLKTSRLGLFCLAVAASAMAQGQGGEALLARGNYLVNGPVACANCHTPRGDQGQPLYKKGLSGGMRIDDPLFTAYAPNITPDTKTGIGLWTNTQLAKAIREGVRPDGSIIGPPMPITFYRNISDADLAAIIAYIKAQPAIEHVVKKSVYKMPLPPNYGPPVHGIQTPPPSDTLIYGQYLANISHCMDCHTPRNSQGVLEHAYEGAGGQIFIGPWGESVARNLTQDKSGLKNWTGAQIVNAIRHGVDRDGAHYKPPMAFDWYKNINDTDMAALLAYLQSLPPQPFGGKK